MQIDEAKIEQIIREVMGAANPAPQAAGAQKGVFEHMGDALVAVQLAYRQLRGYTVAQREAMIAKIREYILNEAETMARMGVAETGMGRVADKVIKHQLVANKTPGHGGFIPPCVHRRRRDDARRDGAVRHYRLHYAVDQPERDCVVQFDWHDCGGQRRGV